MSIFLREKGEATNLCWEVELSDGKYNRECKVNEGKTEGGKVILLSYLLSIRSSGSDSSSSTSFTSFTCFSMEGDEGIETGSSCVPSNWNFEVTFDGDKTGNKCENVLECCFFSEFCFRWLVPFLAVSVSNGSEVKSSSISRVWNWSNVH